MVLRQHYAKEPRNILQEFNNDDCNLYPNKIFQMYLHCTLNGSILGNFKNMIKILGKFKNRAF
jgi:hypothetical protein